MCRDLNYKKPDHVSSLSSSTNMPSFPPIYITVFTHDVRYDSATDEWTAQRRSDSIKWYLEEATEYDDFTDHTQAGTCYTLPVEDLGLTRDYCLDYINAKWRFEVLLEEADFGGNRGLCLVNPQLFAEQEEIMGVLGAKITETVNERFDPWLRRRHLLAMLEKGKHLWFEEPTAASSAVEPAPAAESQPPWAGLYP